MLLRKINAGFSLICALLLLDHAVYQAARMLSRGSIVKIVNFPMQVLFILMLAHGILSIVLAIRGHKGGGAFFGNVGSFEEGYEFDAVVMDDSVLAHPQYLNLGERMERAVYLGLDEKGILGKFVGGRKLL